MKITQVGSYFPPDYGGIESHIYYLSKELVKRGHDVTVLTSSSPSHDVCSEEVKDGISVKRLWTPFIVLGFPFMPALLYHVLRGDADIVHAHINSPTVVDQAALGSWLRGFPLIVTYHADLVPEDIGLTYAALRGGISWLYENLLKRFDLEVASRIVATTPLYAESSESLAGYLEKVSIVPNGVDLEMFRPSLDVSDIRRRLGFKEERILFFTGRLVPYKGLDYLLAAFSRLCETRDDIRLVVLGNGPLMSDLRRQVQMFDLEGAVRFIGSVSERDLPRFYAASDIVVIPSRSRSEGFSIAALQGMACGKPVVATRVGGVPFLVRDGKTGIIVEPKSVEQLSTAISRLLDDASLADRMGAAGRKRAEQFFGWDRVAEMIERVYESVV